MQLGQKIKELRMMYGLTQEELADRSELSKGFISQLERNLTSPSITTLMDILQCLGTSIGEFFNEAPDEQIVFGKQDYFVKEDTEYKNEIKWIIPNAQKNTMEPPTIIPARAPFRLERFQNSANSITAPKVAPNPAHAFSTRPKTVLFGFNAISIAIIETPITVRRLTIINSLSLAFGLILAL